jgi:chromosome segregation ATPase
MSSYRHRHFVDNDAEMLSASAPPLSQSESAARIAELEARLVSQREESEARVAELEAIIASQREDLAVANGKLLLSRTASVPVAEQSENEALRAALKETQQVLGDVQVERNHWRLAEEDAQLQISALEERYLLSSSSSFRCWL